MTDVKILLENEVKNYQSDTLGVNMESTPDQILEACQKVILEESGIDIKQEGIFIYNVRKLIDEDTILVLPKTVAGNMCKSIFELAINLFK